ncbi:MAG TPA: phenylalanine--tRNA ligase subunit beta [bacterium]|nr:phenylalanine--tRNA ligase subunit beta [bacterium]HOL47315.1 phenylalanine--tRNA ligase subunit beta [bacterium]HPQ17652.1 phenylalanine--tRNA ligase subunit beta [bacterium]
MKALISWLKDFVDIELSVDELADKLTNAGLEVEGINYLGKKFNNIIVGKIEKLNKHPESDNLFVCLVDIGNNIKKSIICSATNLFEGALVPVILSGSALPDGKEIKTITYKNVISEGMLCSKEELGLAEFSTGIFILPTNLKIGDTLEKALKIDDAVFEISITPNRPDCLSIIGIAREIAAITGQKLKKKKIKLNEIDEPAEKYIQIEIKNFEKCPRYIGKLIKNIKIKESPFWMQYRIEACGMRAINNIVDITNYVLLEFGQPLHSFDYDLIDEKKIIVRTAKENEEIITLDNNKRILRSEDLVIADANKSVAIAGIMGGSETEVSAKTKNILLESAYFQPATIRKTSKYLNLSSEASYRFERGTDIINLKFVADYAAQLIAELGEGQLCKGEVDIYKSLPAPQKIELNTKKVKNFLGVNIPEENVIKNLELLEFQVEKRDEKIIATVPSHRVDIENDIDLIEEIARIYGFDKINWQRPVCDLTYGWLNDYDKLFFSIKDYLAKYFYEVITYSFISPIEYKLISRKNDLLNFYYDGEILEIKNPLSIETSLLRPSFLFNLLNTVKLNINMKNNNLAFFETGKIFGQISRKSKYANEFINKDIIEFTSEENLPYENDFIGCIISEPLFTENWIKTTIENNFFLLKMIIEELLKNHHFKGIKFMPQNFEYFQPGQSAAILLNEQLVGVIGKIHPDIIKYYDISDKTFFAELNFTHLFKLYKIESNKYNEISRYPSVRRDIAIIIKEEIIFQKIKEIIDKLNLPLLENYYVIDVYKGSPIPEGYKNIAIAFIYRSKEKTLTEEDINETHQKIFNELVKQLEAKTR